jgi:hypothetical protein
MELNEPDIDPEAHREELIADAEEIAADEDAEKQALLEAVKNDEEFEHGQTEWVQLGDVDLRVKAWFPGNTFDTVRGLAEAEQNDEIPDFHALLDSLAEITEVVRTSGVTWEETTRINDFWQAYYAEHGTNVIMIASERVLRPALDNMEQRAPQSFPGERHSDGFRSDVHDDRQPSS